MEGRDGGKEPNGSPSSGVSGRERAAAQVRSGTRRARAAVARWKSRAAASR